MKKDENKKSKIQVLKESWKNPRKKALIKLSIYFLLFFILIIGSLISNSIKEPISEPKKREEFITNLTYKEMQNNLTTKKYNIIYEITNNNILYKLSGNLENNILIGYLELPESIIKVKYENNIIYKINNEIITEYDISPLFEKELINIKNLFDILANTQTIIKTNKESKEYSYVINLNVIEYNILVIINKEDIKTIKISNDITNIIMNFDNITK